MHPVCTLGRPSQINIFIFSDIRASGSELYKLDLEQIADNVCQKSDLIIINGGDNPQQLYFAHRKGWTVKNDVLEENSKLNDLKDKGAKYIFINRKTYQNTLAYPLIFQDDNFSIYNLTDP